MRIMISGGTGFIGVPLVRRLLGQGHTVGVLSRNPSSVSAGTPIPWDGRQLGPWTEEVAAADAVINLAGENIAGGRWTEERKRRILASRLDATGMLVQALNSAPPRARAFVSASAIGYYGSRGDEVLTESAAAGSGFLAEVSRRWEEAAAPAAESARLAIVRIGIVLAADGGALAPMLLPFRLGLGGPIGDGEQWMSWIERDDLLSTIQRLVTDPSTSGVYNATAPEPVRNREFTRTLADVLRRPHLLGVPAFAIRLAMGEMAGPLLLESQRVMPSRLLGPPLQFGHATLTSALRHHLIRG
ncbi:MAG: TIGR01777 family oxidoreductase [Thermoanaerobaculia bacterium]